MKRVVLCTVALVVALIGGAFAQGQQHVMSTPKDLKWGAPPPVFVTYPVPGS